MSDTIKIQNPWKVDRSTPEYYHFTEKDRVYQDGDFSVFCDCRGVYTHTYKDVAITQRGAIDKDMFHNLKHGLNTDDYQGYQRPKEIMDRFYGTKQLTWVALEGMLREMNKKGLISRQWCIKEEAMVFIVNHLTGYPPIQHSAMINTFTKDFKVLEIRVIDNNRNSAEYHAKETEKYTERFQKALQELKDKSI